MKCKDIEERFSDYLSGGMTSGEKRDFKKHLAGCEGCRVQCEHMETAWKALGKLPEEEPSPAQRSRFYAMLETEKRRELDKVSLSQRIERWVTSLWPRRPVVQFGFSLIFLVVGLFVGTRIQMNGHRNGEMAMLREEVSDMRQMVSMSLLNNPSSSERLRGVSFSSTVRRPSDTLLESLLNTLNSDPNVNVRLSAVDALFAFSSRPGVRDALIASLSTQTSPLVQISLIDLLVQMQEKRSLEALRRLIQDQGVDHTVKRYAEKRIDDLT